MKLKKIYPLSLCEIRILRVESENEEHLASPSKSQTKELESTPTPKDVPSKESIEAPKKEEIAEKKEEAKPKEEKKE